MAALSLQRPIASISDDERTFFAALGKRVMHLRKARNTTQVQLAEALGVSQQTVQADEVGRRRIPRKRGPVPKVQRQLERISALPRTRQRAVMDMIEALLAQQGPEVSG